MHVVQGQCSVDIGEGTATYCLHKKTGGLGGAPPVEELRGGGMKPPFSKKRGNLTAKKCLKNAIFRISTGGTLTFYRHCILLCRNSTAHGEDAAPDDLQNRDSIVVVSSGSFDSNLRLSQLQLLMSPFWACPKKQV